MSSSASSASQRSSSNSATGATCWKPAFATIVSSPPNAATAASTAARLPSRVVRSAANGSPGPVAVGLEIDREHLRAGVHERLRDGAADPAGGAGDDRLPAHGTGPYR